MTTFQRLLGKYYQNDNENTYNRTLDKTQDEQKNLLLQKNSLHLSSESKENKREGITINNSKNLKEQNCNLNSQVENNILTAKGTQTKHFIPIPSTLSCTQECDEKNEVSKDFEEDTKLRMLVDEDKKSSQKIIHEPNLTEIEGKKLAHQCLNEKKETEKISTEVFNHENLNKKESNKLEIHEICNLKIQDTDKCKENAGKKFSDQAIEILQEMKNNNWEEALVLLEECSYISTSLNNIDIIYIYYLKSEIALNHNENLMLQLINFATQSLNSIFVDLPNDFKSIGSIYSLSIISNIFVFLKKYKKFKKMTLLFTAGRSFVEKVIFNLPVSGDQQLIKFLRLLKCSWKYCDTQGYEHKNFISNLARLLNEQNQILYEKVKAFIQYFEILFSSNCSSNKTLVSIGSIAEMVASKPTCLGKYHQKLLKLAYIHYEEQQFNLY